MNVAIYASKRFIATVPLLLFVLILNFCLLRLAPGSPLDREAELPHALKVKLEAQYGLDQPLPTQFWIFLKNALRGDFGQSYTYKNREVRDIIAEAFPVSARIGLMAMTLAVIVGCLVGALCARRPGGALDQLLRVGMISGKSVPPMVLAPLFVAIFAVSWELLPVAGWHDGALKALIGPVCCLALYDVAAIGRLMRGSFLEVKGQKYITALRAKGLKEWQLQVRHVLREASLPLVSYLGPALSSILIGTVIVEQVFNIPGLGRYLVHAAVNRDYTLTMGITTLAAALLLTFNLLSDLLLAWLDPRIRLS